MSIVVVTQLTCGLPTDSLDLNDDLSSLLNNISTTCYKCEAILLFALSAAPSGEAEYPHAKWFSQVLQFIDRK